MGQLNWISGIVVVATFVVCAILLLREESKVNPVPLAVPIVSEATETTRELQVGSNGSALATAAFGLSALQPETFNGDIVLDIIEASPLEYSEKDRLAAKLMAAKAGNAELPRVLSDIRMSLAIE
jgi:hypothetical protein